MLLHVLIITHVHSITLHHEIWLMVPLVRHILYLFSLTVVN